MHSINQNNIDGLGCVKLYDNGIVGIHQRGMSHPDYATGMSSLSDINPQSNDLLFRNF